MESDIDRELIFKASLMEKQADELNEHLSYVSRQIAELDEFRESIRILAKTGSKEMLASIGKGVYAKASLEEKKLFVSVGAGVIVRKTPEETEETINRQLKSLHEAKSHLKNQLEICNNVMREILSDIEKKNEK